MLPILSILILLTLLVLGGVVFKLVKKQNAIYAYDVRQDYQFQENLFNAERLTVELTQNAFEWPESNSTADTAFLKVELRSSGLGIGREPSIEMVRGNLKTEQFIERGARGTRYLNISPLLKGSDRRISLSGKGVSLTSHTAELILFNNALPDNPKIMVIAPHPDDAEIAAFGLYHNNKDTHIITVAAGDGGPRNFSRLYSDMAAHYLKKGQIRTWNSITVPMLCGIPSDQTVNLGFFDGTFKKMYENQSEEVAGVYTGMSDINTYRKLNTSGLANDLRGTADWISLVNNLEMLVTRIQPDLIITPHPLLDSQEDHKYISLALFEAIRKAGRKDGQLFFYANHYAFNEYFPYGRLGSAVSLPPNFTESPYFSSVYSHALSEDTQRDKMFSMEAMHDLRLNTDRHFSTDATSAAIKGPIKERLGFDDSYYRRAVRSNELFFVAPIKDLFDDAAFKQLSKTE